MSWSELTEDDIYDVEVESVGWAFDSVRDARNKQKMCCEESPPKYLVKFQIGGKEPPGEDLFWYSYTCGNPGCNNNYEMFPDDLGEYI